MFAMLILIMSIEMTWYLRKQERNWANFLNAISFGDYSRTYQKQTNSKDLEKAYNLITERMESLQTNKEAEFRLLQTVLRHVSVAVICFKETGEVVFSNKAFSKLLEITDFIHIDKFEADYPQIYQVFKKGEGISTEWIDHKNGQKLFVKSESFKLKGKPYRLVSLADIRSSLDAKELESYQKLMRVMTHEIMNSTTPILSLIRVVNKKLIKDEALESLAERDQKNVAKSLEAIEVRTEGMLKFVEAYKQINRPVAPHLELVQSKELLDSLSSLMQPEDAISIVYEDNFNGPLKIDRHLMTQVLINLIKNALDAVRAVNNASIWVNVSKIDERMLIQVIDNGAGVSEDRVQEIFVPFYTTKADGSGIGLALSRNIVRAHGGTLTYSRDSGLTRFVVGLVKEN
ncbi:hypothetical protein BFP71_14110 [Roseivirga misakiensis]|uniref:histidine kinase n=2 Tax=Roseivirga misakiensis TaxID=1563681 RepID=A0A1E5SZP0_9BACT|nr:hypothetical protein BFP71_14110 [Roseivirga misakiensis]